MALLIAALLVTCHSSLVTAAFAGTHVTATYDLGANPRVMATVNGTPQYGLVFAQRNKRVTYGEVEYGPRVVKGYLNSSGQLNDGAGNLWLDLIPNLGATPGDSYYVVTFNIQGRVHAEIWVVSDVVSVAAEVCRQAQPPSSTAPALFYQFLQQAGDDLPQRQKLNFAGSGVSCVDNAGQLRTDCAFSGGGGGSGPKASATVSGTVKTDVTASDPAVYLQSSTDSLLSGKVSATRNVSTSSPLTGGGPLSSDLTLSCPTCAVTGHSHVTTDISSGVFGWVRGGTNQTSWNAGKCVRVNDLGTALESAASDCGIGGGGITTLNSLTAATQYFATPATAGTAPNWSSSADTHTLNIPMAATTGVTAGLISKAQFDTFNGKQDALGFAPENSAHRNAANGYAPLDASTKVPQGNLQEVLGVADLTDYSGTSGSGATAIKATFTSLASNDVLKWSGTNWINSTSAAKADALTNDPTDCSANQFANSIGANGNLGCAQVGFSNLSGSLSSGQDYNVGSSSTYTKVTTDAKGRVSSGTSAAHAGTGTCAANNFVTGTNEEAAPACAQPSTSNLSDGANVVKNNQTNTYSTGTQDFESASVTRPFRRLAYASFPGTCTANREFLERSDPGTAGQVLYVCNSGGNGWDLVGDGGGGSTAFSAITSGTNTGATMTIGSGATVNGAAGGIVDLSSLTPTTGFKVPIGAGAVPTTNGLVAYDSSTNDFVGGSNSATVRLVRAGSALTSGQFVSGSGNGAVGASGYTAVAAGSAGVGPSKVGTATSLARSDHDHRSVHAMSWYFPGTPPTGVQNLRLTFPDGAITNIAILDMRVTVNTVSASSSTFNIQRCVVSSIACSATESTWVNIYSTVLTLAASNYKVAKGSAPDQNVGSLVPGDQFKANLVTIGASLADVTVEMTYKYDTEN